MYHVVLGFDGVGIVSGETKNAWPCPIFGRTAGRWDHAQSLTIRKVNRNVVSPEMCPASATKVPFFRTQERILTAGATAESACWDTFGRSQVLGRGSSEGVELFNVPFKVVQTGHVFWRWAGRLYRRKFRPKLH